MVEQQQHARLQFSDSECHYVMRPDELISTLVLTSCERDVAQAQIDDLRFRKGFDILLIKIRGAICIKDRPLEIYTRMLLMFEGNCSCLKADVEKCTAISLLSITGSESFSCTAGGPSSTHFDGGGKDVIGVHISCSKSFHIDHVKIDGCLKGGIVVEGTRDVAASLGYEKVASVTRCFVTSSGQGITISSSFPFVIANNNIMKSQVLGMLYQAPSGVIVGNQFEENGCDLSISFGTNGIIMQNIFSSSVVSGASVILPQTCTGAFLLENIFLYDLQSSLNDHGIRTMLLENKEAKNMMRTMFGPVEVPRNRDIKDCTNTTDADSLIAQLQQTVNLLPFQIDIYVIGSMDVLYPTDISEISRAIDAAREYFGDDPILVMRVDGHFVSSKPEG